MRNFFYKVNRKITNKAVAIGTKAMEVFKNRSGEGFIDTAVKILMSVVIGALILAGLYMLFKDNILFCSRYDYDRNCYA